ncbi:MAG: helical backbone metal receptor [Chitinophagales bacterium]|nr:helical backbone metal receptor [Chitinophagales bacterium]
MVSYPKRIVSLVPSITATLCDVGMEQYLVGRTKFCIHDKEKLQHVRIVGGTKQVNYSIIDALQPDLILCNKEENTKEMVETLSRVYSVWVSDIRTIQDNFELLDYIGVISGNEAKTDAMKRQLSEVFDKVKDIFFGQRVLYLIWYKPWMCAGGDTFIDAILHHLGYVNVIKEISTDRYPILDTKKIPTNLNVDKILLSSEPFPFKQQHLKMLEVIFPAAKIQFVNGEWFSWYGSRMKLLENVLLTNS